MLLSPLKHIAIAGNIGAGKTTLVTKLAHHYGWEARYEAVDNNPYLADFYEDMTRWAFPLQIYFLHSRYNQVVDILRSQNPIIQDRTIYEDAHIFAKNLYQSGHLTKRDFENYFSLFQSMAASIKPPDLLIYLRAEIHTLTRQIAKRGRAYESGISLKYLKDLNDHYEEWIGEYTNGRLLVIDINDLDYVERPEDLGHIIQKIDAEVNGLF